ncbi:MAG: precorrin-4 C(11)-methyltransferase [Nitrospirae bacterium]|nr:precorrin-4 C(11)-methyltransferase [Nitrospirota bacterium]
MYKVYFVGAGPGDPELLTIKGRRLIDNAKMVIYAGSLVNPVILNGISARIIDSAPLNLDQIINFMVEGLATGNVVRLHTGDPAFYSAIFEQIERLKELNISYEVIPGVSSLGASAAAVCAELTVPGISQTVIITRMEGRTPVPAAENIRGLAAHRASMAIFLSIGMIEKLRDELLFSYPSTTPIVIVEKASWPEQRIIRGTLNDIVDMVNNAGIKKTAMVLVGSALDNNIKDAQFSKLYDKNFKHEFRP